MLLSVFIVGGGGGNNALLGMGAGALIGGTLMSQQDRNRTGGNMITGYAGVQSYPQHAHNPAAYPGTIICVA